MLTMTRKIVKGFPMLRSENFGAARWLVTATSRAPTAKDMTAKIRKGDNVLLDRIMAMQYPPLNEADALNTSVFPEAVTSGTNGVWFFWGKKERHYVVTTPGLTLTSSFDQKVLLQGFSHITLKYMGDTLWFGTESHGLVAIDLNSSACSTFKPSLSDGGNFDTWTVFGIEPDDPEHLWLATSRGLWHFNKRTRAFKGYGLKDGLPNAYIYCLTKDLSGKLWLGTGNGLSCFDPQTKSFRNYFPADGLVNIEYNRNSAYTSADGRIFMGGSNGVDYFYPDRIKSESITANPFFSAVFHQNHPLDPAGGVQLKAGQNSLTFLLGVDEPFKADKFRFQWRLDGTGEDWGDVGSSRTLNLANLKANDYTLRIRLQDPNGEFTSKEAIYKFSIAPYWYETWLFRIMALLVASGMISFFMAYRQRQKIALLKTENEIIRLKAEQAAMLQEERERITADLHDDAGATLSSIYIYSDLANRMWDEKPAETRALLGKMAENSREMMQKMNDIIWSLKSPHEEKNSIQLRLTNLCLDLFGYSDTQVHFDMDEKLDTQIDHAATRKNLLLIAKEALNNAAKYSEANNVWVRFQKEKDEAVLTIRDDGKGFDTSGKSTGNGLGNMQRRAVQMRAGFTLESKPGEGVCITVRLPIPTISYS